MSLRYHEIAESSHRILNPFTDDNLALLGEICALPPGARLLDLCCGKAELLCTWSARYGVSGVGVDISEVFLAAAHARAEELGVTDRVTLVHGEAAAYARASADPFDVVSCIGATWIGDGLEGTLALLRPRVVVGGLVLVGEPYWIDPPPRGVDTQGFVSLVGTLRRIEAAGFTLVEMVLADGDSWDRYVASQWNTVDRWHRAHPDDPEAQALWEWIHASQRTYLEYERRYLGWGVFVLR